MKTDEPQKQNFAGACLMAPAVVVTGLVILIAPFVAIQEGANKVSGLAAFQAGGEMVLYTIAAGFCLWMVSLPGLYLFGYPLLRLLHRFRIRSYLVHGMAGAVAGAPYLLLGIAFLSGSSGWLGLGEYIMLIGLLPGFLVGLAARWAMSWRWLKARGLQ